MANNLKSTIPPRCDNCRFSTWLIGLSRHLLICRRKVNFIGKWSEVRLGASCGNFYPSQAFLSSRRSFNKDGKAAPAPPRRIPLTRGKFAIVDADDYYQLNKYRWFTARGTNTFYAASNQQGKRVMIHRVIMEAPEDLFVDHIDHNGLNNCKSNLRLCSKAQNNYNRVSRMGNSKYKGVCWNRAKKKWVASIQSNGKKYDIGCFTDEIAAARAYDKKARDLHGEFACLNFPPLDIPGPVDV